jgi:hypothetical protein
MSISLDIKLVLEEIGTSFVVKRDSGDVAGGYLDYEMNRQVTKPFIREFFLEATFQHDSAATNGDVVEFSDGRRFLVMNDSPENFENELISREVVLYMCNVSGELLRESGELWDVNYRSGVSWQSIRSNCYASLTSRLFGTDLQQDEELAQIGIESQVLYLPSSLGARSLDRYQPASGEYYKVEQVIHRYFPSVDVCYLAEDTRV